jgi:hypothetical protein
MKSTRAFAILNVISFLIHLAISYMVQMKMINSKDVGEISDAFTSLFTPAGFTFGIWGIIYTCLGIFCVFHIVMAYKRNPDNDANKDLHSIGPLFIIINLATAAWLVAWTGTQLLLSIFLIFIQLICLLVIHERLHIHNRLRPPSSKLATEFPMSIYFGWISLATIANISSYLVSIGWNGWGISDINWTLIMIIVSTVLGLILLITRRNIAFGLVVIWGLFGILSKLSNYHLNKYDVLINVSWAGIVVIGLVCLVQVIRSFRHPTGLKN